MSNRLATFRTHTRVVDIEHAHGQAQAIATTNGQISADAFVLGAGARTGELTKRPSSKSGGSGGRETRH